MMAYAHYCLVAALLLCVRVAKTEEPPRPALSNMHVAVVNIFDWCETIIPALVYPLAKLGVRLDVYALTDGESYAGLDAMLAPLWSGHVRHMRELEQAARSHPYDLAIIVDWYKYANELSAWTPVPVDVQVMLDKGFFKSVVINIHEPHHVLKTLGITNLTYGYTPSAEDVENVRKNMYLDNPKVQFITISPHVSLALAGLMARYGFVRTVHWYAAVYPINFNTERCPNTPANTPKAQEEAYIGPLQRHMRREVMIQGQFDFTRRDYHSVFRQLITRRRLVTSSDFRVGLIGKKADTARRILALPGNFSDKLETYSDLPFKEYLHTIHAKGSALLPAFAVTGNDYYTVRASSTIHTSMLTGVPVVANERLLRAYAYLCRSCVIYQHRGESEADVLERFVNMTAAEHQTIVKSLYGMLQHNLRRNVDLFRDYLMLSMSTGS